MSAKELSAVKKALPHGAQKEIAKRLNINVTYLSQVMNGKKKSPKINEILRESAKYLAELQTEKNEVKELLNSVLV